MSTDPVEVFTDPWAQRFLDEINRSADYKQHGASWNEPLTLEMSFRGDAPPRAVLLDLRHGTCRSASCNSSDDAPLVIRSTVSGWKKILAGRMDPIWGIMSGQLKLIRGNLTDLVPYGPAAKALVEAAARIDATFPSEEGP